MRDDAGTTIMQLRDQLRAFVEQRDWNQFHSPKNLSMSLAIEAAELMEHFQWISTEQSRALSAEQLVDVGEELADVLCYALAIANELELDVSSIFRRKMELNQQKYPIEQFRGRYGLNDPSRSEPG